MKKIVHVGQMKSGTTYIQNSLSQNRSLLKSSGFLYPGRLFNQQHACYGICGSYIPWVTPDRKWERLGLEMLNEINYTNKNVLISSEALSCMKAEGVADFVNKIGGVDEVVITVRNFHRVILSAWQQSIKGGGVRSLTGFIDYIARDRVLNKGMWKNYSFGETVRNWLVHAKVNIIVVGGNGAKSDLLSSFSEVCGLPRISEPVLTSSEENKSLKREDVELLRRLNSFNKGMEKKEREGYIRWLLHNGFFPAASLNDGSKVKMPKNRVEEITSWAREELGKIPDGVNVVGDLSDIYYVSNDDVEVEPFHNSEYLSRANCILSLIYKSHH